MAAGTDDSSFRNEEAVLLSATGRADTADALMWIAEGRRLKGGVTDVLLAALVAAADLDMPEADRALRAAAKHVLHSTLDTSAELVLTDTITPPGRYEEALAAVAARTPSGTLRDITANIVGAAQAVDPLVVEALGLAAGLSWRDVGDRAHALGTGLPGDSKGPWSSAQVQAAFAIIDDIVMGRVQPQLDGATSARPLELLLTGTTGWDEVERLRGNGVSYGTLLAQRDVGSAWSAHRNRTNNDIAALMRAQVLHALDRAGVGYWVAAGAQRVPKAFLRDKVVRKGSLPGQLSVVTKTSDDVPTSAVLVAVARDGGTARKTAATLLKVPGALSVPASLILMGTGWAARGESDHLVRAFDGRVYTERSLDAFAAMTARVSVAAGSIASTSNRSGV